MSAFGRQRKRRVIPNNAEEVTFTKKKKENVKLSEADSAVNSASSINVSNVVSVEKFWLYFYNLTMYDLTYDIWPLFKFFELRVICSFLAL